ncbi:MAG TPA: T9SS type A sorting domain-containing protein, partial [Bacteroidales bacterium]|nr:T9SS type A sorting domain-containing protein [Bacteroidales bacterium]
NDYLEVIGSEYGTGNFLFWVETVNDFGCHTSDTVAVAIVPDNGTAAGVHRLLFSIYPNPCREGFYLLTENHTVPDDLRLVNANGQVVMNGIPASYPFINMEGRGRGVYMLIMETEYGVLYRRLVKL